MKKVYISTLGCSKNLVDSEMMMGSLLQEGYVHTNEVEEAEIAIVNTCGFIEAAKEESIQEILQIAQKKEYAKLEKLVVTGCLAQRYSEELSEEIPEIDLILGTTSFVDIVERLENLGNRRGMRIESIDKNIPSLPRHRFTDNHTAYLKIAEGCDNLCTYCIIPKLRGKYRSRELSEIVEEAKMLAKQGVREIILIAQDTTKYGLDINGRKQLGSLLKELDKIEGIDWIRILYSYPEDIDEELVLTIKDSQKVLPYFDMPIQHASDKVLKKMNRKTTAAQIRRRVEMIRKHIAHAVIRTTIIVGFPQESDEDFDLLCDFVKEMKFDRLGVFEYSLEEGTPAAKMSGQIEDDLKSQRKAALMSIQQEISKQKNKEFVGTVMEVLVESEEEEGIYLGRTYRDMIEIDGLVYVHSQKKLAIGDLVSVEITDSMEYDLIGSLQNNIM